MALGAVFGAASAALAWRHVRRVDGVLGDDPAALAIAVKRVPTDRRIEELARRAAPGSWPHEVAREVIAAADETQKVAAVNIALGEVDHAMAEGAGWPRAGLRLSLLGGALFAFAAYIASGREITWPLASLITGAAAAIACVEADRRAKHRANALRRDVDALVASAFGDLDAGSSPQRSPRGRSRGRSR